MALANLPPNIRWLAMVLRDLDLKPSAKTVGSVMATRYMNYKDLGSAFPGTDNLVRDTGLNERTVRRSLDEMVDAGYLVKARIGGIHHGVRVATMYAGRWPKGRRFFVDMPGGNAPNHD